MYQDLLVMGLSLVFLFMTLVIDHQPMLDVATQEVVVFHDEDVCAGKIVRLRVVSTA